MLIIANCYQQCPLKGFLPDCLRQFACYQIAHFLLHFVWISIRNFYTFADLIGSVTSVCLPVMHSLGSSSKVLNHLKSFLDPNQLKERSNSLILLNFKFQIAIVTLTVFANWIRKFNIPSYSFANAISQMAYRTTNPILPWRGFINATKLSIVWGRLQ